MRIEKILSEFDGLGLEIAVIVPEGNPKGVIQFSHGMAEHKERYYDFMNYLSDHGYVCVIHDHRGHGGSVEKAEDYGFFYTENELVLCQEKVQIKYALLMLSYPAKASALSSNAA